MEGILVPSNRGHSKACAVAFRRRNPSLVWGRLALPGGPAVYTLQTTNPLSVGWRTVGGLNPTVRLALGVILLSILLLLLNAGQPSSVAGALDETGQVVRYLLLALAWTAYCAVHSAMISETVIGTLKRRLGDAFRFYRLFFNAVAIVLLVPVVSYSMSLRRGPVFRWDGPWLAVRYALVAVGVLLFAAGGRHYRLSQFLGIAQLRGTSSGGLATGGGIDSSGVLGLIRHPWYAGLVLLLWARDLDVAGLVVSGVLTVYILVGTLLEERKLVHEFGDAYRGYQERVSMFVPAKWFRSRIAG
jgi:protein-S-isoprenylcysteine O-methyltransferase Ste14